MNLILKSLGIESVEEVRRMLAGQGVEEVKDGVRRCQECGKEFEPRPNSKGHQLNCGDGCRSRRSKRRARERRKGRGI